MTMPALLISMVAGPASSLAFSIAAYVAWRSARSTSTEWTCLLGGRQMSVAPNVPVTDGRGGHLDALGGDGGHFLLGCGEHIHILVEQYDVSA